MFQKTICAVAFSAVSFITQAVETLDVLVVFDSTISNVSKLDTSLERGKYANKLIDNLHRTFNNSGLQSHIQFRLKHQLKSGFANTVSGSKESIIQLTNRYETYIPSSNTGTPTGWLNILQNAYQADVVIAITKEGNISTKCGIAVNIPNKSQLVSGETLNDVAETAMNGLFFISAKTSCLNDETLAAHEFGHTAGLYHGKATDGTSAYNSYKPNMLLAGAAGFNNFDWNNYRSVMADKPTADTQLNQFSDKNRNDCTYWDRACGDSSANSVATLKKYASEYNKRGNWYYTH